MTVAGRPGPFANKHSPPDAHKFNGLNPAKIFFGRIIEVEKYATNGKVFGVVADNNCAPRSRKGQVDISAHAVGERSDVGFELAVF